MGNFADGFTDEVSKARAVLKNSKRLLEDLELFPLRILINREPVNCTVSPRIIRRLKDLIAQLDRVVGASSGGRRPCRPSSSMPLQEAADGLVAKAEAVRNATKREPVDTGELMELALEFATYLEKLSDFAIGRTGESPVTRQAGKPAATENNRQDAGPTERKD